jgi:hypothetical protein
MIDMLIRSISCKKGYSYMKISKKAKRPLFIMNTTWYRAEEILIDLTSVMNIPYLD